MEYRCAVGGAGWMNDRITAGRLSDMKLDRNDGRKECTS
jgi:hypothetical protein